MMALRVLLSLLLSLPLLSFAQGVSPVSPVSPTGTRLFPNAFASSDNIAAQTATAMHGLVYIWDGSNWDRWTGAVTVTGSVAVTGTFWQATQPVSGTVSANQAGTWTVQPGNTANTTPWLVNEFPSTGVIAGQQSVTGTATALATNTTKEVCVKALLANTLNVYVGPSGVTTSTGLELGPGDSYCTRVTNTNALFVISSGAGPSVSWAARN